MIYTTTLTIPGSTKPKENPLARFQSRERTLSVRTDGTFRQEEMTLLGYEAAPRYLPYRMQEIYDRGREVQTLTAIVMENDYLKATFLPEYGGRLYSLYQKEMGRELLYCNPVIQPGNLAILNAWISGGIEWNMGQVGHSFTTCDTLFASVLKDNDGNEFLRMFEYERCHNLFWHMDFHLPEDSRLLQLYVRIVNDTDKQSSCYWWTNTAVQETKDTRVLSCTDDVIYLNMDNLCYGKGRLPYLPVMPDKDASYPSGFDYANEYFFQNPDHTQAPWEAAAYPGWTFFERSSGKLRYRKMFCWGTHQGGKHWKDYLSDPGRGDYIEIQAGLSRSQVHGAVILPGETIDFVQCFGGLEGNPPLENMSFLEHQAYMEQQIDKAADQKLIQDALVKWRACQSIEPKSFLTLGSGFGALEACRRKIQGKSPIPSGFLFPEESMDSRQAPWLHLLKHGVLKLEGSLPQSFMVQDEWRNLLLANDQNACGKLHLGIIRLEAGEEELAEKALTESNQEQETISACYYLALLYRDRKDYQSAEQYFKGALQMCLQTESGEEFKFWETVFVCREYFRLLTVLEKYEDLEAVYQTLPLFVRQEERLFLLHVSASLRLGKLDQAEAAFSRDYSYIRENETDLSDLWILYQQLRHKQATGEEWTVNETLQHFPVPYNLDYRTRKRS